MTMGKRHLQKMQAMSNMEKNMRNAELAACKQFLRMPKAKHAPRPVVKTKKVLVNDGRTEGAVRLQALWRGHLARQATQALRMAVAASVKEAAAASMKAREEHHLHVLLLRLLAGERLTAVAVVRGDGKVLQAKFGDAALKITATVRAVGLKRAALKAVDTRRRELAALHCAAAARKAAEGIALKAALDKERDWHKELKKINAPFNR